MDNSLLDFVKSVVLNPDAAAAYSDNPAQAIADAHLTDVTSADVNSLIPVVSESLAMGSPVGGADAADDSNVWASGAATAAFDAFDAIDAFDDHVPAQTVDDARHVVTDMVDQPPSPQLDSGDLSNIDAGEFAAQAPAEEFHIDDSVPAFEAPDDAAAPLIDDHHLTPESHEFDIFE